jgi:putative MATE family efflux protein
MRDLTQSDIPITIRSLTYGNFIGLFSIYLLGLVDAFFLSLKSEVDLAAAVFANPFVFIALTLFSGIASSKVIFLSKKYKTEKDTLIYYSNYINKISIIVCIIFMSFLFIFIPDLLDIANVSNELRDKAIWYSKWHYIGIPLCFISMLLVNFLRSKGNSKYAAQTMFISAIFNVILDPIFIFYFDLGTEGAAIATSLSWLFSFSYIFYVVYFKYDYTFKSKRLDISEYLKILPSISINQLVTPLTILITILFVNQYSTEVLAGYGVAVRLERFLIIISFAIGTSIIMFSGQNINHAERKSKALLYSFKLITILFFIFVILLNIFIEELGLIFNLHGEAMETSILFTRILSGSLIIQSFYSLYTQYLTVLDKHNFVLYINLLKGLLILPVCLYIGDYYYGKEGLFYGLLLHHIIAFILLFSLSYSYLKSTFNLKKERILYE